MRRHPSGCGWSCATYSADAYEEFRAQSRAYQDVTGYEAFTNADNFRLTGHGQPQPATGIEVIGNFFQVLGVQPAMGRLFTADESRGRDVALLANAYWRHQFDADPAIVGKAIELNGTPVTVVGVLPASFDYGAVFAPGAKVDLFVPLNLDRERTWGNIVTLMGRLKPGVTVAQALDDANRVAPNIYFSVKFPETLGRYKGSLIPVPLKDYVIGKLRRSLIALWFAVGTILLIAGVNLSNLLLARAAARAKEFAVRGALGASRGRIVRQLLMESLVLSGIGAAFGLGLALLLIAGLAHQGSLALPLLGTLRIDSQALGWTVLIAVLTAMIFGLLPGLRMASGNLQTVLKDSSAGAGLGRKHERIRAALVISEIAMACVLLVSAGLLFRSFLKVLDVDLGFQPDRAASIRVAYDDSAPSERCARGKTNGNFPADSDPRERTAWSGSGRRCRFSSARAEPRMGYARAAGKDVCSGHAARSVGVRDYAGVHPCDGHSPCTAEISHGPMDRTVRQSFSSTNPPLVFTGREKMPWERS